jgi:WD40 repeat protein
MGPVLASERCGAGPMVDIWAIGPASHTVFSLPMLSADVAALAFSPDGRFLAVYSADGYAGTVQLWDARRWQRVPFPSVAPAYPGSLSFSPDGTRLAAGDISGSVWQWDVPHRRLLGRLFSTSYGNAWQATYSPDGRFVAYAGMDGAVRLWDVQHRRQYGLPMIGHTSTVTSIAFSPHGDVVAAASDDDTVWLWDVATGQQMGAPLASDGNVLSIAFSPDGQWLAVGSDDGTVRLWNVGLPAAATQACVLANRNLTAAEWQEYVGVPPYHATCPTHPA